MASEIGDDLFDEDLIYEDCDDDCDVNEEEEQALLSGANEHHIGALDDEDVHGELGLHQESEEYLEVYQDEADQEIDHGQLAQDLGHPCEIENDALAEEEEEEEDEEEEARRDRFKSERVRISLSDSNRADNIPDSLDDVKPAMPRYTNEFKRKTRGFARGRGQNFSPRIMPGSLNFAVARLMGFVPGHGPQFRMPFPQHMHNNFGNMPPQIRNPGFVNFGPNPPPLYSPSPPWGPMKRPLFEQPPEPFRQMHFSSPRSPHPGNQSKRPVFSRLSKGENQNNQNPNLTTIKTVDIQGATPMKQSESSTGAKRFKSDLNTDPKLPKGMPTNNNYASKATAVVSQPNIESKNSNEMSTPLKEEAEYKKKVEEQQRKRAEILAKKALRRKEMAASKAQESPAKEPLPVEGKVVPQESKGEMNSIKNRLFKANAPIDSSSIKVIEVAVPQESQGQINSVKNRLFKKNILANSSTNIKAPLLLKPQNIPPMPRKNVHQRMGVKFTTQQNVPPFSNLPQEKFPPRIDTSQLPPPPRMMNAPPRIAPPTTPTFHEFVNRPPPISNRLNRPPLVHQQARPNTTINRPQTASPRLGIPPLSMPPPVFPRPEGRPRHHAPSPLTNVPRSMAPPPYLPGTSLDNSMNKVPLNLNEPPPQLGNKRFMHPPPNNGPPVSICYDAPSKMNFPHPPPNQYPPPHIVQQNSNIAPLITAPSPAHERDSNQHESSYDTYHTAPEDNYYNEYGYEHELSNEEYQEPYEYQDYPQEMHMQSEDYMEPQQHYINKGNLDKYAQPQQVSMQQPQASRLRPKMTPQPKFRQQRVKMHAVNPAYASHEEYYDHDKPKEQNPIPIMTRKPKRSIPTAVKKRYKRITRRNRIGEVISIKKVPIDDQGNVIGPEETEFATEQVKEGYPRARAMLQPQSYPKDHVIKTKKAKKIISNPIRSSAIPSSNLITPTRYKVKLSKGTPAVAMDHHLETYAWMDNGSGYYETSD